MTGEGVRRIGKRSTTDFEISPLAALGRNDRGGAGGNDKKEGSRNDGEGRREDERGREGLIKLCFIKGGGRDAV